MPERAGYHPAMMVALLLYGCHTGKPSSRRIERATREDVGFRVIAGDQHPVVSPVLSDLCAAQVKKGSPWPAR